MRPLIAGNWKMNGNAAALAQIAALAAEAAARPFGCDLLICPPATLLERAVAAAGPVLRIGGQDCHAEPDGAFTGDVAAEMLADAGASAVIVGHSERRQFHGESDAMVQAKALAAHRARLMAIICVGESQAERDAGEALDVVGWQLAGSVPSGAAANFTAVAYEPVWAIGSGRTPGMEQIAEMHAHIRRVLTGRLGPEGLAIRLLYGGSVKPGNAAAILDVPEVNGALVGGASLDAKDFSQIARSVPTAI